jgi:hypothetical protein
MRGPQERFLPFHLNVLQSLYCSREDKKDEGWDDDVVIDRTTEEVEGEPPIDQTVWEWMERYLQQRDALLQTERHVVEKRDVYLEATTNGPPPPPPPPPAAQCTPTSPAATLLLSSDSSAVVVGMSRPAGTTTAAGGTSSPSSSWGVVTALLKQQLDAAEQNYFAMRQPFQNLLQTCRHRVQLLQTLLNGVQRHKLSVEELLDGCNRLPPPPSDHPPHTASLQAELSCKLFLWNLLWKELRELGEM